MTTAENCGPVNVDSPAELGNGNAVAILAAPCDGTVIARAVFASKRDAAPPSSALLRGKINGVALVDKSDSDFDDARLVLDPPALKVNKNATVTFETYRTNHHAKQTAWEMTLSFTPN